MDKANEHFDKAIAFASSALTKYIWFAVLLVIIGILVYYRMQIAKKKGSWERMEKAYSGDTFAPQISEINNVDPKFKNKLFDYYIASSYNSCCAGDFQDSYVSTEPLKEILLHGARVLDFAIYSVGGTAVVAAGPDNSTTLKGTYNSLPINQVLAAVKNLAFSSGTAPNANDPLFLQFRIKSNRQDVYPPLAEAIKSNFGPRLLDATWGFDSGEGRGDGVETKNLGNVPLLDLQGKVIIIAHQDNHNFRDKDNPFFELINLGSSNAYFQQLRNHAVIYTYSMEDTKGFNKTGMTLSMPDWSEINTNPPAIAQQALGVQMICMNYQNLDKQMKFYLNFFNENGSAFVLKPPYLRYIPKEIPCPPPQNPKLTFAPQKYTAIPGAVSFHM